MNAFLVEWTKVVVLLGNGERYGAHPDMLGVATLSGMVLRYADSHPDKRYRFLIPWQRVEKVEWVDG